MRSWQSWSRPRSVRSCFFGPLPNVRSIEKEPTTLHRRRFCAKPRVAMGPTLELAAIAVTSQGAASKADVVAVEEPLEIRLVTRAEDKSLCLTMRTPGDDENLVYG